MKRRRRSRGLLKWLGLTVSLSCLALWWGTAWYYVSFMRFLGDGTQFLHLTLEGGEIRVFLHTYNEVGRAAFKEAWGDKLPALSVGEMQPPRRASGSWGRWSSKMSVTTTDDIPAGTWSGFDLVLWLPAIVFAIPTGVLWYRWYRRRIRIPPRHCESCGYDLRGSRERCPECGTKFDSDRPTLKAES